MLLLSERHLEKEGFREQLFIMLIITMLSHLPLMCKAGFLLDLFGLVLLEEASSFSLIILFSTLVSGKNP